MRLYPDCSGEQKSGVSIIYLLKVTASTSSQPSPHPCGGINAKNMTNGAVLKVVIEKFPPGYMEVWHPDCLRCMK
jgi:hypothetical protein